MRHGVRTTCDPPTRPRSSPEQRSALREQYSPRAHRASRTCSGATFATGAIRMQSAVVGSGDSGGDDPDEARPGLGEELALLIKQLQGVVSALFMPSFERGAGVAGVVFETREQ